MIRYDQADPNDKRRQDVELTIRLSVPAQRDWNETKWPGHMSVDPGSGQPEGEPPITFRDDFVFEIERHLSVALPVGLYVHSIRFRADEPREPAKAYLTLDDAGEEPW